MDSPAWELSGDDLESGAFLQAVGVSTAAASVQPWDFCDKASCDHAGENLQFCGDTMVGVSTASASVRLDCNQSERCIPVTFNLAADDRHETEDTCGDKYPTEFEQTYAALDVASGDHVAAENASIGPDLSIAGSEDEVGNLLSLLLEGLEMKFKELYHHMTHAEDVPCLVGDLTDEASDHTSLDANVHDISFAESELCDIFQAVAHSLEVEELSALAAVSQLHNSVVEGILSMDETEDASSHSEHEADADNNEGHTLDDLLQQFLTHESTMFYRSRRLNSCPGPSPGAFLTCFTEDAVTREDFPTRADLQHKLANMSSEAFEVAHFASRARPEQMRMLRNGVHMIKMWFAQIGLLLLRDHPEEDLMLRMFLSVWSQVLHALS